MMSKTVSGQAPTRQRTDARDSERVLDVLGDDEARRVLEATGTARTVSELVDELGLSQSTAYRKIRSLEDVGLVERTNKPANGNTATQYRRATQEVTVQLGPELRVQYDDE